jgi:CspA family cold shock protein
MGKKKKDTDGEKKGFVKWFDPKKGFGFIETEDEQDVFVHYSNINMSGFRKLDIGDNVIFKLKENSEDDKRPEAIEVSVLAKDKRYFF